MTEFVPNQPRRDDEDNDEKATLVFKASRVDLVVVVTIFLLGLTLAIQLRSSAFAWIGVIAVLIYHPLFVWLKGATVGHSFYGLRIVDRETGRKLSLRLAIQRCFNGTGQSQSHPQVLYLAVDKREER
jgi:hypothetical protein